jgi:hypothetical protein
VRKCNSCGKEIHEDLPEPVEAVSTPLPQQEEPADQAWNRAFQYVDRHGWTGELDGIPHYTAPKEFRN